MDKLPDFFLISRSLHVKMCFIHRNDQSNVFFNKPHDVYPFNLCVLKVYLISINFNTLPCLQNPHQLPENHGRLIHLIISPVQAFCPAAPLLVKNPFRISLIFRTKSIFVYFLYM